MGILKAFADSLSGTFADQWKDLITAGAFDELTVVAPGILKSKNNGRGENFKGSVDVISNGSIIFVPENTAAVIYSQGFIENVITQAGGYEYQNGEDSVFSGSDLLDIIFDQTKERIRFGGISRQEKKIAFINLKELRGILFGTKGAQIYHDKYYDSDLEIVARGSYSLQIVDVIKFIKNYLPANTNYYTFDDIQAKAQISTEFVQSLMVALNEMSKEYRLSELPSQSKLLCQKLVEDKDNAGTWEDRFGFKIVKVAIEHIEFTERSKELIDEYNKNRMSIKAYKGLSQQESNIAAQQKIAEGIKENGLGEGGAGVLFGMNMAQGLGVNAEIKTGNMSVDKQMETLKNMKELLDAGLLTREEFDNKKKEVMGS